MGQIAERIRTIAGLRPSAVGNSKRAGWVRPVQGGPLLFIRICREHCVIYEVAGKGRNLQCRHRIQVLNSDTAGGRRLPSATDIRNALKQSGIKTRNVVWILPEASVQHSVFALPRSSESEEYAAAELAADERFGDSISDLQMMVHRVPAESAEQSRYNAHVMSGEMLAEIHEVSEALKWNCRGIFPPDVDCLHHVEDQPNPDLLTCVVSLQHSKVTITIFLGCNLIATQSRGGTTYDPESGRHPFIAGEIRRAIFATRKYAGASHKIHFVVVGESALSDELRQVMERDFRGSVDFAAPLQCPFPATPETSSLTEDKSAAEGQWLHAACHGVRCKFSPNLNFAGKYRSGRGLSMRAKVTLTALLICLLVIMTSVFSNKDDNSHLVHQLNAIQSEQRELDDRLSEMGTSGDTAERWQQWYDSNTSSVLLLSDITRIFSIDQSIRVEQIDWSVDSQPGPFRTVMVTGTAKQTDDVFALNTDVKDISNLELVDCRFESLRDKEKYHVRFTLYLKWQPGEPQPDPDPEQQDVFALQNPNEADPNTSPTVTHVPKAPES